MTYESAELRCNDELPLYGENLARSLDISGEISGAKCASELKKSLRCLSRHASELLSADARESAAAEWLLDNHYLAKREGAQAAADLAAASRLPECGAESALRFLCRALLRSGAGELTAERIELFFEGCQSVYVLSRRELSVLLPSLRAAVIAELAELYSEPLSEQTALSARKLFTSLRVLAVSDFTQLLSAIDKTEQLFLSDPSGIYPLMAEKTRENYKRRLEKLSKKGSLSEHHLAEHILRLSRSSSGQARHIGYYLFTRPLGEEQKNPRAGAYIASLCAVCLFFVFLIGFSLESLPAALLSLLPVCDICKTLTDRLLIRLSPPAHIPRMELKDGVPPEGRTICVITALLSDEGSGARLAKKLEEYRLASRECGENLLFGILADLPDSEAPELYTDEGLIRSADAAIGALNEKYGGGFYLFLRHREFNKASGLYMAPERKRGAVMELARLLCGRESGIITVSGSGLGLRGVKYILTLDEDTRLIPGTAAELIGAMLHPLNTPVIDEEKRVVTAGHGLIHPRICTSLSAVNKTAFSRLYAPAGGSDPYGSDSSELYMDLFQSGGFAGKGIIDAGVMLKCLEGRIPDNSVLSHDALEGAFLRGGFMGDAELADGFPSNLLSFQRRLNRWRRGDLQNAPWIFRRGGALPAIERFRLLESIRRALSPGAVLTAFFCAFFISSPAIRAAGLIALLSLLLPLLITLLKGLFKKSGQARLKTHSGRLHGSAGALRELFFGLLFLPYDALDALFAAALALWRMLISRRRLLDWTTSLALEKSKSGFLRHIGAMWSALLAAHIAVLSPSILGKAAGLFWLLSPLAAYELSRQREKIPALSPDDRSYLLRAAKSMWGYFDDFCTPRNHFLPPDNWQEQPDERLARRTSPTNIGLCLASCLAAIDLELTTRQNALGLIENLLATLRRLPKWEGNLYNWYDTETLRPLHPAYVSAVDCGNLVASLVLLRQGLEELCEQRLAGECSELLSSMSLAPFYDEDRRLFSIGWDAERRELSDGCYDLMASEARISSFVAIARGDVPKKHWRQLSRALTEHDGRRGMVSWTGSMFEYMMPRLFFASPQGSLGYESERFCVGVQRARTKKSKLPWGISESAYFSLDSALSYRYKAHGCAALALKRDMDFELVVSPYSSFLALPCERGAALENLRALERLGGGCGYGFWEAVDFSPRRCDKPGGQVVRCVMAHHIGMSILACANALLDDVMPRRLMSAPEMAAFSSLLEEKLPTDGLVLRRRERRAPARPPRCSAVYWEKRGDFTDFAAPACCLLSNGVYSLLLTDSGLARPRFRGVAPYFSPGGALSSGHGLDLYLLRGEQLIPLLPTPDMPADAKSDWEFTLSAAKINLHRDALRSQVVFSVADGASGEKRVISVSGASENAEMCSLIICLRPLLLPEREYSSHPAFAALGIHAKMHGGALILRRLARGGTPETYMCLAASAALECSARAELIPGRGGLLAAIKQHLPSPLGWLSNPFVCAAAPIRISDGVSDAVSVVLTVGGSESEVYSSACRMLTGEMSAGDYPAARAAALGLSEKETEGFMELLPALAFPQRHPHPRAELWSFGISGDYPVIVRKADSADALPQAEKEAAAMQLFCSLGCPYDLVLLCSEGGDYLRPVSAALSSLRSKLGDAAAHLHIIDAGDRSELLESFGAQSAQRGSSRRKPYSLPDFICAPAQSAAKYEWLPDGSFRFHIDRSLPPRAWSNLLTNGSFGYIASDCGSGNMWFKNAREYALNPPSPDILSVSGSETIVLEGKSLFASPFDSDCSVSFSPGYAQWEKSVGSARCSLSAFVPMDTDARVFLLQWDDGERKKISWCLDLLLGSEKPDSLSLSGLGGVFKAQSPSAPFKNAELTVCSNGELTGFTASREVWLRGETDDDLSAGECFALRLEADSPFVLVCGCDAEEKLKALRSPAAALAAFESTCAYWRQKISALEVQTPLPALDRLINTWLPYQALACRLMGRCSMYQSGGAVGFRDQLQDAVNLITVDSSLAREQILDCCRHQYTDGDVMHWWHELDSGTRGVRTRCSDDLVWLVWALCEYTEKTGDRAICRETAPWLVSRPLDGSERERYEAAVSSPLYSSVLEHAAKAMDMVLRRETGAHGLLKIGGGDWNDGFSRVGEAGRGESVWLTWFFVRTAERFAALLKILGSGSEGEKYISAASSLGHAADMAWDGQWYLRGYFDDGSPIGSSENEQCRIDSIAQSFAAFCPGADKAKVGAALSSAAELLFDKKSKVIELFSPPFESASPDPGYIQSYGPGFRENGGQYTHAAVWLIMALLCHERQSEALKLLSALIPELSDNAVYAAEPFVLAADVYSNPDCAGMAGWSWYTGAAGWLYRVVTEELLGLKPCEGSMSLSPRIPKQWGQCHVRYRSPSGGISDITINGGEDPGKAASLNEN